jgi:23S rRNA (adenine2503-C2)-methyltransferase
LKRNIKNISDSELREILTQNKQPAFRSEQIKQAIYKNRKKSFSEISNLPKGLIHFLEENFTINSLIIKTIRKSKDGSIKFLFSLEDGNSVEAVYMPWFDDSSEYIERETLCISSMAGCSVGCAFCATGTIGFKKNLDIAEIIDQIFLVEDHLNTKLNNIVMMGMGEPLLNYNNVVASLDILTDPNYEIFTRKRITVSTSGIAPRIKQMAKISRPVKLAISLHATSNGVRDKIMPINQSFKLELLMDSIEEYYKATKIPITYEYIIFDGLNDTDDDINRLTKIARRVPSRVNIIPFNDISFTNPTGFASELKPARKDRMEYFANKLRENGVASIVRDTFGGDIEAACGQLALTEEKKLIPIEINSHN